MRIFSSLSVLDTLVTQITIVEMQGSTMRAMAAPVVVALHYASVTDSGSLSSLRNLPDQSIMHRQTDLGPPIYTINLSTAARARPAHILRQSARKLSWTAKHQLCRYGDFELVLGHYAYNEHIGA